MGPSTTLARAARPIRSNAIVATCKSWHGPSSVTPPIVLATPPTTTPAVDVVVYDPVMHASGTVIPDFEHQVTQQEQGEIDPTGNGGTNTPTMANKPQVDSWNTTPDLIPGYLQLEETRNESKLWVELPDCAGGATDIALADDVSNATIATCKTRPAA